MSLPVIGQRCCLVAGKESGPNQTCPGKHIDFQRMSDKPSQAFHLIFRQFFKGLPKELEDAAYLDGCGAFKTFIRVMVPNASSSFLTVFLFSIVWYWNDYYVSSTFFISNHTVALALQKLSATLDQTLFQGAQVGTRKKIVWLESGCLLTITPILIMYVFLQKHFTEGLARSGLVG